MNLFFYKYHGTGNDFIIIDNRQQHFNKNDTRLITSLCDRRFGIGADGLILLENHTRLDFNMIYFNANGHQSSMCGNGGRCITHFAKHLDIIKNKAVFEAIDGKHFAEIDDTLIRLKMNDVSSIEKDGEAIVLNTGSPHYVLFKDDLEILEFKQQASKIRYNSVYKKKGINVNFVNKINKNTFNVRTYERGVEDETLSCGTGVTAVALAMHYTNKTSSNRIVLMTAGGKLDVIFKKTSIGYEDIWLIGPAKLVYKGELK